MERFNKTEFMKEARKRGLVLESEPVFFTGHQRVYNFYVKKGSMIRRIKLVTFSDERINMQNKEDSVNVYYGESSKGGIWFKSYTELIEKIKRFKE